jgi:hypothetical protein
MAESEHDKIDIFDIYDYKLPQEQITRLRELKSITGKAMANAKKWQPLMKTFLQGLNEKYPNREFGYMMLYHFIIGSTPPAPAKLKGLDLPNNEMEKFIIEQLAKI